MKLRTPNCYVLPEGYVGWARVDYEVMGGSAIEKKDGCRWLALDETGRLSTSSHWETGWATDRYYYENYGSLKRVEDRFEETRQQIWNRHYTVKTDYPPAAPNGREFHFETFFVGSEQQLKKAANPEE
jgi:hypothetical protein